MPAAAAAIPCSGMAKATSQTTSNRVNRKDIGGEF